MLKKRIRKWGLYKKNNESDIRAAIQIALQRESQRKYKTEYNIRGRRVSHGEIRRYLRRKGIHDMREFAADPAAFGPISAPVVASTPTQSPEPPETPSTGSNSPDVGLGVEQEDVEYVINSEHSSSTLRGAALSPARESLTSISPSLSDSPELELFREALAHNKGYFDYLSGTTDSFRRTAMTPNYALEFPESPELKNFVAALWRGRDLLLENRMKQAFEHFDVAFKAVKSVLAQPSRKFLPELYEVVLNFQLDDSKGIVRNLLEYIAQMAAVAPGMQNLNQSIVHIALRLLRMSAADRADASERLLANVGQRFDSDLAYDQRDVLTINNTISRSAFCRYPLAEAIIQWKARLEAEKRSVTTPTYENCVLIFELAKCYRLLNKIDDAISWLNVALSKAPRLENPYGRADIKVRCFRALGWVEVKRDNWAIAHNYLQQAYRLARLILGMEDSLTHLVESDVKELECRMSDMGIAPHGGFGVNFPSMYADSAENWLFAFV
jgi:tetratricopeptide (TPR) repeat protein